MEARQLTVTAPRGGAYQRRQIERALRTLIQRASTLPPTQEHSDLYHALNAAQSAVWKAQRKYGEE